MNTNSFAKRILVYGDSLVWGKIPLSPNRYPAEGRFSGVLQIQLGSGYEVIEEGLRSRMAKGENPFLANRDGYKQFSAILASHLPLDIILIFLGTNDLNSKANKSAKQIATDLGSYGDLIRDVSEQMQFNLPQNIIYCVPPMIAENYLKEDSMFLGSADKSKILATEIEKMCNAKGFKFFDSNKYVKVSELDGVHLSEASNVGLGNALAKFIKIL